MIIVQMMDTIPLKNEQWIVINFLTAEKGAAADIHLRLGVLYGEKNQCVY